MSSSNCRLPWILGHHFWSTILVSKSLPGAEATLLRMRNKSPRTKFGKNWWITKSWRLTVVQRKNCRSLQEKTVLTKWLEISSIRSVVWNEPEAGQHGYRWKWFYRSCRIPLQEDKRNENCVISSVSHIIAASQGPNFPLVIQYHVL